MKRLILSVACTLSLASCGGPPTGPDQKLGNESSQTEVKLPASKTEVFIENSGGMDGYVKDATGFENTIYSYLSDVQYADLGTRIDSLATKNILVLNYINSEVLQQKLNIREFIEALESADSKIKGGRGGMPDMSNILDTVIPRTGGDEVFISVSDCISSPGKRYRAKDNANEYIVAQQIGIKNHIIEKLAKNPNSSIAVMRLTSQFDGIYYNRFDDRQPINSDRPLFTWLMGDKSSLNIILKKVELN